MQVLLVCWFECGSKKKDHASSFFFFRLVDSTGNTYFAARHGLREMCRCRSSGQFRRCWAIVNCDSRKRYIQL